MKYFMIMGAVLLMSPPAVVFAQGNAVNADDFLNGKPAKNAPVKPIEEIKAAVSEKSLALIELESGLAAARAENEDDAVLKQKISLAREMHKIRPTREQVDSAVFRASMALPSYQRKSFVDSMAMMLNYNAIERISVDAMIETYTLQELASMVEYYSKDEARSASKKVISWASIVQPEIISMIDKALMRIKTGQ